MHLTRLAMLLFVSSLIVQSTSAATIRVHVSRNGNSDPLEVILGRRASEDDLPDWFAQRRLTAPHANATFSELPAGVYVALVSGPEPLQRAGTKIVVAAKDTRDAQLSIHPTAVMLRATLAGAPLANARFTLNSQQYGWHDAVTAGADGRVTAKIWETGEYLVQVRGGALHVPYTAAATLTAATGEWRVDVPDRIVRGRIVDDAGATVAGAEVALRSSGGELIPTLRTHTDAAGAFELQGVRAGSQTLRVTPLAHLIPTPLEFELRESDTLRDVPIVLQRGFARRVVVRRGGDPVSDATVVVADANGIRAKSTTTADGTVVVPTPADAPATFYVFPHDGAPAIAHAGAAASDPRHDIAISVRAASSSFEVIAKDERGQPLAGLSMLLRIDGELVPPEVCRILAKSQSTSLATDDRGTLRLPHVAPGIYELWPYQGEEEAQLLVDAMGVAVAPITVNVTTGRNSVQVRFRRRD